MNRILVSLITLAIAATPVAAAPFDMSPEADLRIVQPQAETGAETAALPEAPSSIRHLLPADTVRLAGEIDGRDYQVYLTSAQASARAVLQLNYINALVVAPETSRLRVTINRDTVLNVPIASSASPTPVTIDVPAGVLRSGFNAISIAADMRHRTDCDIGSTYQLWTDLGSSGTYLSFFGPQTGRLSRLDDLAAVGMDAAGNTTIRFVSPNREGTALGALISAAAQALAIDMRVPNPIVQFTDTLSQTPEPGVLQVVLATADQLPEGLETLASEAQSVSVAAFAAGHPAQNVLVLSGPSEASLAQAVDSIRAVSAQYAAGGVLPPTVDRGRSIPMITGSRTLPLEELGVDVVSFNGRRYATSFDFALPADFYANNYGQARINLNAAYSGAVMPGSQVDVFVNGQIASSTPILRTDDSVRSLTINVPMKDFRPGRNNVQLIVGLRTQEDITCAPGTVTVGTDTRFLIAGDSTFVFPDFGRINQLPNLAAFSGEAFPYASEPPHLVVTPGPDGLATGLTALARLAAFTDREIALRSVSLANPSPSEPALFVGPYSLLPADTAQRMSVLAPYSDTSSTEQASSIESTLQRWRAEDNSSNVTLLGRVQGWIADLLDIRPTSFGLPIDDNPYAPRLSDQAFAIQKVQPEGGVWTMITTPSSTATAGIAALTLPANLAGYGGRVTTLPAAPGAMETVEPSRVTFFEPEGISFENWRYIAANWLSGHVMAYALGLALLTIILTLATRNVLGVVGRKPQ